MQMCVNGDDAVHASCEQLPDDFLADRFARVEGRVLPQDLMATILNVLGIPPSDEYQDSQGRPLPASRGQVIRQLF